MLAPRPTTGIIYVEWIMTSSRKKEKKRNKTNDRWIDAMGGWKLCYCEFQTPQGVPIPAAISIGGSVERERERRRDHPSL
jgi:hypothetical protein